MEKTRSGMNAGRGAGKDLYVIGGPMGVGKTAACRQLQRLLDRSVFLDGDWCWDARPFQVTEETREMVLENIAFLLNSFLRCSAYDHVIFCWVLHRRGDLGGAAPPADGAVLPCGPSPWSARRRPCGPGWRGTSAPEDGRRTCWTGALPICRCMTPWTPAAWT